MLPGPRVRAEEFIQMLDSRGKVVLVAGSCVLFAGCCSRGWWGLQGALVPAIQPAARPSLLGGKSEIGSQAAFRGRYGQ